MNDAAAASSRQPDDRLPPLSPAMSERMLVFRDGKRRIATQSLIAELDRALAANAPAMDVLLRAGELESALADAGVPYRSLAVMSWITDAPARALVSGDASVSEDICAQLRAGVAALPDVAEHLSIGTPEGFAFYALHPLAFARLAREVHAGLTNNEPAPGAVIGIRSIGATLSAVVAAELKCERITVRPTGHPFDRSVTFTD